LTLFAHLVDLLGIHVPLSAHHVSRLQHSVQASTRRAYCPHVDSWSRFAVARVPPVDSFLLRLPLLRDKLIFVIDYLEFLIDVESRNEKHIDKLFSAVRLFFLEHGEDAGFLREDLFSLAKRSAKALARCVNPVIHRPPRAPIPAEFIVTSRLWFWSRPGCSFVQRQVHVAVSLAWHNGCRLSEYLYTDAEHCLLPEHVLFLIQDGAIRIRLDAVDIRSRGILACHVLGIALFWPTTKTVEKRGTIGARSSLELALRGDLVAYCRMCPLIRGQPFFIGLRERDLTEHLRSLGRYYGIPEDTISSHCLRHGRATDALASGADSTQVNAVGNWSHLSNSSRIYAHESFGLHATSSSSGFVYGVDDLRLSQLHRSL
jgi:integrase